MPVESLPCLKALGSLSGEFVWIAFRSELEKRVFAASGLKQRQTVGRQGCEAVFWREK